MLKMFEKELDRSIVPVSIQNILQKMLGAKGNYGNLAPDPPPPEGSDALLNHIAGFSLRRESDVHA